MISRLDHLVLTVRDLEVTVRFYTEVLGMERVTFGEGRTALRFGEQKINLHVAGQEIQPHAAHPTPGSADLCFITEQLLDDVLDHLRARGIPVELGPVPRTGALGPIQSIYLRDPNGNLIEIARYAEGE